MGDKGASPLEGAAQILSSERYRNLNISTSEKPTITNSSNASLQSQASSTEPWSEDRITQELLREGSSASTSLVKDGFDNEATASVSETRLQELAGRKPRLLTQTLSVSSTITRARRDAETVVFTPGGSFSTFKVSPLVATGESSRRRASSPLVSPANKKLKETVSDEQIRGRMASLETQTKAKDYTRATEKPPALTKKETDTCLTCIRYGRKCRGTTLVSVGVKGEQQIKCVLCNKNNGHGGRRCYWKDESQNIHTYEDAVKAHKGIVNTKNTRAGRIERAKKNPKSRLALDAKMTYAPPTVEERRASSSIGRSKLRPEQGESQGLMSPIPFPYPQFDDQIIDDNDDNDTSSEYSVSVVDDDDIKKAFKDAMAEVTSILQATLDSQWTKQMLWAGMLIHVRTLGARLDIIEAIEAKLVSLIHGAMTQDWLDDDEGSIAVNS